MPPLILTAALLIVAIGAAVFWANPQRFTNRVFAGFSLVSAGWLFCVYMAMRAGLHPDPHDNYSPVPWVRAASAIGAFFPFSIWLMKESILTIALHERRFLQKAFAWLVIGCGLASLCYVDSFVFNSEGSGNRSRGISYTIYNAVSFALYLLLIFQTYRQWRVQTGIRRLEMQVLILNAGIGCLLAIIVSVVGNYFDLRFVARLPALIIFAFFATTAWAVTIHRVFDARQVLVSIGQRAGLIFLLSLGTYWGWHLLEDTVPSTAALVLSIAVCSTFAFWLERKSRDWFSLSAWQNTAVTRQAALEIARREADPNKLVIEFEALLPAWVQTNYGVLLFDSG